MRRSNSSAQVGHEGAPLDESDIVLQRLGSTLSERERELARRFAHEVVKRGVSAPALLLLEGARPLNFVLSMGMAFFAPIVRIFADGKDYCDVQEMLEERASIPYIIRYIEQLDEAHGS